MPLAPSAHHVVIGDDRTGLALRAQGLQIRDAILILAPGPTTLTAWLVREPPSGAVAEVVLQGGAGALHIDPCRIPSDEPNPSIARRAASRHTGSAPISNRKAADAQAHGRIERRGRPEVYMEARPSEALGRWPPNLMLIHKHGCQDRVCAPGCHVKQLDAMTGTPTSRLYPQFASLQDGLSWLYTLTVYDEDLRLGT
jgi:hypothetical protein